MLRGVLVANDEAQLVIPIKVFGDTDFSPALTSIILSLLLWDYLPFIMDKLLLTAAMIERVAATKDYFTLCTFYEVSGFAGKIVDICKSVGVDLLHEYDTISKLCLELDAQTEEDERLYLACHQESEEIGSLSDDEIENRYAEMQVKERFQPTTTRNLY